MLINYCGINIDSTIIIVEKQNEYRQGYVVRKGNKGQLNTALMWARYTERLKDENNKPIVDEVRTAEWHEKYPSSFMSFYKEQTFDGIVHEYTNGTFKLALVAAADESSTGGRLSFWNCAITAEDGNTFLIGINQDCLIELIKHNSFIDGVCQTPVWLGRIKNNVGAFTENMDEFKQGQFDAAIRELKKTAAYAPGSILIPSRRVYYGRAYMTFSISSDCDWSTSWRTGTTTYTAVIYRKPKPQHYYDTVPADVLATEDPEQILAALLNNTVYPFSFIDTKAVSAIADLTVPVTINTLWKQIEAGKLCPNSLPVDTERFDSVQKWYNLQYKNEAVNLTDAQVQEIYNYLFDCGVKKIYIEE